LRAARRGREAALEARGRTARRRQGPERDRVVTGRGGRTGDLRHRCAQQRERRARRCHRAGRRDRHAALEHRDRADAGRGRDRSTGERVWRTQVTEPGIPRPNGNYSTGGFIGATAVSDGVVVGGTAVGGAPALHALDTATGAIKWQQPEAADTYASAAIANGVVFLGSTTDFTFRALDLQTGEVLWSKTLRGGVAGGAAVVGDDVIAVAGIREPGVGNRNRNSGVYHFSLHRKPVASAPSTTKPTPPRPPHPQAPPPA